MKKTNLNLLALLFAFLAWTPQLPAATGVFGSYIGINPDGAGNSWYGTQEWGTNNIQDFQGANLGTFDYTLDTLQISAFQVQTFKSGAGDVTGIQLQYRVYRQGNTPGSFNLVNGGFLANASFASAAGNTASGGGDQNWGVNPTATLGNLLSGISTNGLYNVEVFYRATTNEGDRFSNNGGSNYIASFTVIPEPSTYALLALGMAGLAWLRRSSKI
ncbi:MAG: PEP-CTERM sorting domain-containing protein [Candidatus Methylacidiphilales bacterium]|nr:PEP-CTERM sorting domain-containing protein [Candidatus Methylacidiphilales bacterium]